MLSRGSPLSHKPRSKQLNICTQYSWDVLHTQFMGYGTRASSCAPVSRRARHSGGDRATRRSAWDWRVPAAQPTTTASRTALVTRPSALRLGKDVQRGNEWTCRRKCKQTFMIEHKHWANLQQRACRIERRGRHDRCPRRARAQRPPAITADSVPATRAECATTANATEIWENRVSIAMLSRRQCRSLFSINNQRTGSQWTCSERVLWGTCWASGPDAVGPEAER